MISDGNHTYAYDAGGRLISVDGGQTATYLYSADGLRVRSTVGAGFSDYIHDSDGPPVGVLGASGVLIRQEIGGLATYTSSGAYFHHRDWLGNLRAVTDQNGTVVQTCSNLPFGDALTCSAAGNTSTYFTGYLRDGETNLDFANARYFSSQFGRFMSPDPLGGSVGDPQSLNRYAYVTNNPLSLVDPSGMGPCPPDLILCYSGSGGSGGGAGAAGGPFGTGGSAVGAGGLGLGICFALNCGFGGAFGGSNLPGSPSNGQIASEASLSGSSTAGNIGASVAGEQHSLWYYIWHGNTTGEKGKSGELKLCDSRCYNGWLAVNEITNAIGIAYAASSTSGLTGEAAAESETAFSVEEKLDRYLLNPEHPVGGAKAKFFEQALGFTRANAGGLAKQLVFDLSKATKTAVTPYGIKFNQVINVVGANGRTIPIKTAWIMEIEYSTAKVRLVTAVPDN